MEKEFTEGDAFVAAYSEYFGVVYKEALKYSGNHHIAEEIAQDAFFTAYIQCGSESKQQIKTWMLMFARYRAMNYIRDHKREVPLAEITMSEDRYQRGIKILWKPSHSRRDCSGCLFHRIYTVWK